MGIKDEANKQAPKKKEEEEEKEKKKKGSRQNRSPLPSATMEELWTEVWHEGVDKTWGVLLSATQF